MLTCQQVLVITVICSFLFHHMLRVNIAIAIVEMVARNDSNTTENLGPRYNWNEEEKNDVLGYFFWGYILTQIPGGLLSEIFGFKIVIGTGLLTASLLTILTPLAASLNYYCLLAVRFCLGIALGLHWPSIPPLSTKWIPPADTSKFVSQMTASSLGIALTLPVCGYLIAYFGWPTVFYFTGSLVLIWSLCWFYFIYDSPDQHPRISDKEMDRLKRETKIGTVRPNSTPWLKILTSGPVWAIIMANTCQGYTFFFCLNQLPSYMSQVLHFNIKQNGLFTSLPYFVRYTVSVATGIIADRAIQSKKFSITAVRKFFTVTLFFGTSVLFIVQVFWGYSSIVSVIVFTGCLGLMGFATTGFVANSIDIAPAYSGTVYGVSQVPSSLIGYITTKVVAIFTKDGTGFEQWVYIFWILVGVNLLGGVVFLIFASGEEQPWSHVSDDLEMEKLNSNTEMDKKIVT